MANADFFSERAMLYTLLSRLFTYPLVVDVLNVVAGLNIQEGPVKPSQAAREALMRMKKPVFEAEAPNAFVEALNQEATRLFEGPGQPVAPPYGSYYLNGKRLMGQEAIAVRTAYLAAQMLPDLESHQPPDHLALELGFLATLANAMTDETVGHLRGFINDHVLSWLSVWKDDVMAAKPHPFFAGSVSFTQTILEEDLVWLNDHYPMLAPVTSGAQEEIK